MMNKKILGVVNVGYVVALAIVLIPLLVLGHYSVPIADDWSYGSKIKVVINNGGNIFEVIGNAFKVMYDNYFSWEGRFSCVLMAALHPGMILGGWQYYYVTTYIIVGEIVWAELYFVNYFIGGSKIKQNKWYVLPIAAPIIMMQFLYLIYPEEALYWYTGGINYSFSFAISLVFIVLYCKMAKNVYGKVKKVFMAVIVGLMVLWVGGNNFATSVSTFLILFFVMVYYIVTDKRAFLRSFWINIINGIGVALAVFAPANNVRMTVSFDGEIMYNSIEAVFQSLYRSALNVYSWTTIVVVLAVMLTIPFVCKVVKGIDFDFKFPAVFTILSFGAYASQAVATMYIGGTTGPARMANVLYLSYYILLISNVYYWVGYIVKKQLVKTQLGTKGLLAYMTVLAAVLVMIVYTQDLKQLTSYKAYRNLRQGFAQQYLLEWEERFELLENSDESIVECRALTVQPEMLFYLDIYGEDDIKHWVNGACANYFGKIDIHLVED